MSIEVGVVVQSQVDLGKYTRTAVKIIEKGSHVRGQEPKNPHVHLIDIGQNVAIDIS